MKQQTLKQPVGQYEISMDICKCFEKNKNENTTRHNSQELIKVVLRLKFIAISTVLKKKYLTLIS